MSKDFPFTTYDFYAYLASGLILFFTLDVVLTHGRIFSQIHWSFVEVAIVIAVAYVLGQIVAIPSSLLLEHLMFSKILRSPITLQLSSDPLRWYEKILSALVGRYYGPLPESTRKKVLMKTQQLMGCSEEEIQKNMEIVFQAAYPVACRNEDTRSRIDDFRNQYGFARNITMVIIIVILLVLWQSAASFEVLLLLFVIAFLMFLRFLKFYSAFQVEIVRTFASQQEEKSTI